MNWKIHYLFILVMIATLSSIYDENQRFRLQLMPIIDKYGVNSKEAQKYWTKIRTADSINLIA